MQIPQDHSLIVAAFFCPQAAAPDEAYLNGLHCFLSQDEHGKMLLAEIMNLATDGVWDIFAQRNDTINSLTQGPEYVKMFYDWAMGGSARALAAARSGIVALPLLLVVQIGQYLRFLRYGGVQHKDFITKLQTGGLQGYCGGLPVSPFVLLTSGVRC